MTNLEGLWAERFGFSKQQFPKVSQIVRANERPILPVLLYLVAGWGGGRAVWFWVTVAGPVTVCSATLAPMLVLSGGAEKFIRVMTSYPPAPDRICNIPTIDQWLRLDYLFTRTVSWRLVRRWPRAAAVPVLPVAAFQTGSFPPVHLPWFQGFYL